jgi:hypothetical protein
VAAYSLPIDELLGDRLAEVWSLATRETWTAPEFSGTANVPIIAMTWGFRTDDAPAKAPLPGLQALRGLQRPLLTALDPRLIDTLAAPAALLAGGVLDHVEWKVSTANSLLVEQTHL